MTEITPIKKRSFYEIVKAIHAPPTLPLMMADKYGNIPLMVKPAAPKSTVGRLMETMSHELSTFTNREAVLVVEIADREEELRQVRASKRAVAGAMASLHGDVALTDDEAQKAEAAADVVAMEALVNVN